jgi:hypothetical protein
MDLLGVEVPAVQRRIGIARPAWVMLVAVGAAAGIGFRSLPCLRAQQITDSGERPVHTRRS